MNPFILLWRLLAPDDNLSAEEKKAMIKGFSMYGWRVILFAFIVYATGIFPGTGFVRASDLKAIQQDMAAVKSSLAESRKKDLPKLILDATERWCSAMGEAKRLRLDSLNDLRDEYFAFFSRSFDSARCEDLK